jgi:hypothetical protein
MGVFYTMGGETGRMGVPTAVKTRWLENGPIPAQVKEFASTGVS